MSLAVRFQSLSRAEWPGPVTQTRRRGPFKNLGLPKILRAIERELVALKARDIVVRAFIPAEQIRLDGFPRANARATAPGVVLEFVSGATQALQRFYCDRYLFWEDNLLSIARAMEKLRAIDRWGVNKGGEQYAGYRAIPAQSSAGENVSVHAAAEFLANHGGARAIDVLSNPIVARDTWRRARLALHPDRGGSAAAFANADHAADVLGAYFGETLR